MTDLPVRVYPRVGLTQSSVERSQTLPQIDQSNTMTSVQGADRVVDTDRTRGENSADTMFIDDMFIRSQT